MQKSRVIDEKIGLKYLWWSDVRDRENTDPLSKSETRANEKWGGREKNDNEMQMGGGDNEHSLHSTYSITLIERVSEWREIIDQRSKFKCQSSKIREYRSKTKGQRYYLDQRRLETKGQRSKIVCSLTCVMQVKNPCTQERHPRGPSRGWKKLFVVILMFYRTTKPAVFYSLQSNLANLRKFDWSFTETL